jgi:hypothetical protein
VMKYATMCMAVKEIRQVCIYHVNEGSCLILFIQK